MGAQDFQNFVYAERTTAPNPVEAFSLVKEQAQYEHGHGGYTGTIAEKFNYRSVGRVHSKEEAEEKIKECMETEGHFCQDKWGPAAMLELVEDNRIKGWYFFGWASS